VRPFAEEKGIRVIQDFPPDIVPLQADPEALALVVSNLIGNALKYTPARGRVTVRVRLQGSLPKQAEISVEDTGIGIRPSEIEAIFSGYYRAQEGREVAKGFGVGLKVSRDVIERHGSRLEVESVPGKGSRFFFVLPIWEAGP